MLLWWYVPHWVPAGSDWGFYVAVAAVSVIAVAAILAIMLAASLLARRLPPGVLPWQA